MLVEKSSCFWVSKYANFPKKAYIYASWQACCCNKISLLSVGGSVVINVVLRSHITPSLHAKKLKVLCYEFC